MKNLSTDLIEMNEVEINSTSGGYAILDGIASFYHTMGSFWHGVYNGFMS